MRAVLISEYGDPQVLQIGEVPTPIPGAKEVLVRVRATALNRADLLQRRGLYPDPFPGEFEIPGLEFSGTVAECGSKVTSVKVGDQVMGIVSSGAYAEFLTIHEFQLMPVPTNIALGDAGAIPEVFITAWDALVCQGELVKDQWALVHAGASGVGTAAIQICKALGAKVAVTCSTKKVSACKELGADAVIDYQTQDFVGESMTITNGVGVNVVLDVIGGAYLDKNISSLALKGVLVQVGLMGGMPSSFNLGALLPKRARIIGTVLRSRPTKEKVELTQKFRGEVLPFFSEKKLRPIIDSRFDFTDVVAAHTYMESNANFGKIIIDVS